MAAIRHDWYLREWVDTLDCPIAVLEERTGWTHRITSQLVNRKTRWNRDHLSKAAFALNLEPWELLMHPRDAMEVRQLRSQIALAAEKRAEWREQEPAPDFSTKTPDDNAPKGRRRKTG